MPGKVHLSGLLSSFAFSHCSLIFTFSIHGNCYLIWTKANFFVSFGCSKALKVVTICDCLERVPGTKKRVTII